MQMGANRITIQNWIVDLGIDPNRLRQSANPDEPESHAPPDSSDGIDTAVQLALRSLSDEEREFVTLYFFMGKSARELAEDSGRSVHKLEALHKQVIRKLRQRLAPFVEQRFGLSTALQSDCPICNSPNRERIDQIISSRDRTCTWRHVLDRLRKEFRLSIRSPQSLIGHEKYHINPNE
jgi:hypothetical protein